MNPGERPKMVGLFLPPTLGYFADVVLGVQEFTQASGRWAVEVCPTLYVAGRTCNQWVPDGILVNCVEGDWEPFLRKLKVPIVQVGGPAIARLARVSTDNFAIGQLAAEHFLERGLRSFAFCGYNHTDWSAEREAGFREGLKTAGHQYTALRGQTGEIYVNAITGTLARWIESLPKPTAIFACHDRCAMLLANTCSYLRVPVPEEIAILGVDDNMLECGFASPPLSSVIGSARRVGYEAATLLDKMMRNEPASTSRIMVPPAGIAVRQSTDVLAIEDVDILAALRFIREHATDPVEVRDVVSELKISRRNLERKFQSLLNRTPQEEIRRARIAHAKMLLLSSSQSILDVALTSGFPSASTFSAIFNRETGISPRIFRRLYSSRAANRTVDQRGKKL